MNTITKKALAFLLERKHVPAITGSMNREDIAEVLQEYANTHGEEAVQGLAGYFLFVIDNYTGREVLQRLATTFAHDLKARHDPEACPRSSGYADFWVRHMTENMNGADTFMLMLANNPDKVAYTYDDGRKYTFAEVYELAGKNAEYAQMLIERETHNSIETWIESDLCEGEIVEDGETYLLTGGEENAEVCEIIVKAKAGQPVTEEDRETVIDWLNETKTPGDQRITSWVQELFPREYGLHLDYMAASEDPDGINFDGTGLEELDADEAEIRLLTEKTLIEMGAQFGMDRPDCFDQIVDYIVTDVMETADPQRWHDGDIAIAFRRWVEDAGAALIAAKNAQ